MPQKCHRKSQEIKEIMEGFSDQNHECNKVNKTCLNCRKKMSPHQCRSPVDVALLLFGGPQLDHNWKEVSKVHKTPQIGLFVPNSADAWMHVAGGPAWVVYRCLRSHLRFTGNRKRVHKFCLLGIPGGGGYSVGWSFCLTNSVQNFGAQFVRCF